MKSRQQKKIVVQETLSHHVLIFFQLWLQPYHFAVLSLNLVAPEEQGSYQAEVIIATGYQVCCHGNKIQSNFVSKKVMFSRIYSKTGVKWPLSKRPKIVFQYQLSLNAGRKYCKMLPLEHSAMLSTFIKLPFVIKILVWS